MHICANKHSKTISARTTDIDIEYHRLGSVKKGGERGFVTRMRLFQMTFEEQTIRSAPIAIMEWGTEREEQQKRVGNKEKERHRREREEQTKGTQDKERKRRNPTRRKSYLRTTYGPDSGHRFPVHSSYRVKPGGGEKVECASIDTSLPDRICTRAACALEKKKHTKPKERAQNARVSSRNRSRSCDGERIGSPVSLARSALYCMCTDVLSVSPPVFQLKAELLTPEEPVRVIRCAVLSLQCQSRTGESSDWGIQIICSKRNSNKRSELAASSPRQTVLTTPDSGASSRPDERGRRLAERNGTVPHHTAD